MVMAKIDEVAEKSRGSCDNEVISSRKGEK